MIWTILIYCCSLTTPEGTKDVMVVVAFTNTRAMTYNPELGYVEWDIVSKRKLIKHDQVLTHGVFIVKNEYGQGYIIVSPEFIEHYSSFTHDDNTVRFHIRYKRKVFRRRH